MKETNIADLRNNLSHFIALVGKGEVIRVCKRNTPVASIIPLEDSKKKNQTILGCGRGSVTIETDLTEPFIPSNDWDMLQHGSSS